MAQPNLAALLAPGAKARNLDLNALLAIASHEGAGGGISDNGHAFGPFQLNDAGGVLTGKLNGLTPQQKNAWAWSPPGIRFAEDGIARVAAGEHGAQAVRDIATRFERPANVGAEIQDALAHYGKTAGGSPSPASVSVGAPAPSPGAPTGSSPLLGQLLAQTNQMVGLDTAPNLASLFTAPAAAKMSAPAAPAAAPRSLQSASGPAGFVPLDGVTVDRRIAPQVSQIVRQFGVKPTSGLRSADHNAQVGGAQNSDHLRGDAVDFSGSPQALRALYQWAQGRFPYVEPWAQTGGSHDHISFRR